MCLIGDAGKEALKKAGVQIANKATIAALNRLPGRILIEINKKVGFRLLTKFGEKGVINLVKVVPVLGGLVGGTVDAIGCHAAGSTARMAFVA